MRNSNILYAANLEQGGNALHRMKALSRLGYEITPLDFGAYLHDCGKMAKWLYYRLLAGPRVEQMNDDLKQLAAATKPDLIFVDKGIFLKASTIRSLSRSIAPVVHYNPDNPFGLGGGPRWRHFVEAIGLYDLHLVPRESNIRELEEAGAKQVILLPFAYEPTVHYPPPLGWSDENRPIGVSFTGTANDKRRVQFLSELLECYDLAVDLRGSRWQRVLRTRVVRRLYTGGEVYDDDYRVRLWQSKICLSFVTHFNRDTAAVRSFEIAASGGFLLAEATDEHLATFEDGKEAVFFSDVADCARLIRRYLPDRQFREKVAAAGRRRAVESGYSNDARLAKVFLSILGPSGSRAGEYRN